VTRGRLPQRAGSLGLNGGGAAATVPLHKTTSTWIEIMLSQLQIRKHHTNIKIYAYNNNYYLYFGHSMSILSKFRNFSR